MDDVSQSIASDRYPFIKATSYKIERWNDCTIVCVPGLNGMINLKLDSSPKTAEMFRKIVASPFFVTQPNHIYNNEGK